MSESQARTFLPPRQCPNPTTTVPVRSSHQSPPTASTRTKDPRSFLPTMVQPPAPGLLSDKVYGDVRTSPPTCPSEHYYCLWYSTWSESEEIFPSYYLPLRRSRPPGLFNRKAPSQNRSTTRPLRTTIADGYSTKCTCRRCNPCPHVTGSSTTIRRLPSGLGRTPRRRPTLQPLATICCLRHDTTTRHDRLVICRIRLTTIY